MKHKIIITAAALAATLSLSNCTSSKLSDTNRYDSTKIVLEQANYKVVATQVKGENKGFHLLSILPSIPSGLDDYLTIFHITPDGGIPVKSASRAEAVENLYQNCGDLRNRSTALINIREETGGTNWFLFSRPKVVVTADLIEYVK